MQLVSEDSDVAIYESPVRPVTQSLIKSTENSVCRRETYSTADLLRVSASLIPRKRPGQEQKIIEEVVLENDRTDFSCPADVGNMRNTLNESVIKCCKKDGKLEEEEKVKQQENHDEPESRLQLNDDMYDYVLSAILITTLFIIMNFRTFSDTEYEEPIDNECLDLGTDMEKQ